MRKVLLFDRKLLRPWSVHSWNPNDNLKIGFAPQIEVIIFQLSICRAFAVGFTEGKFTFNRFPPRKRPGVKRKGFQALFFSVFHEFSGAFFCNYWKTQPKKNIPFINHHDPLTRRYYVRPSLEAPLRFSAQLPDNSQGDPSCILVGHRSWGNVLSRRTRV